jgi:3-oxoacyl-(acyl-carrier-protein) synthase
MIERLREVRTAAVLATVATADWPQPGDPPQPPPLAGFVVSTFSPLVAATAERCLAAAEPPPSRTAIIIASASGDAMSAEHVAHAVDTGGRVGPLLFFQSVPNAVAGHIAAKHGLTGPIVCLSGDAADGRSAAELLVCDGDADAALVIVVQQGPAVARAELLAPTHRGAD